MKNFYDSEKKKKTPNEFSIPPTTDNFMKESDEANKKTADTLAHYSHPKRNFIDYFMLTIYYISSFSLLICNYLIIFPLKYFIFYPIKYLVWIPLRCLWEMVLVAYSGLVYVWKKYCFTDETYGKYPEELIYIKPFKDYPDLKSLREEYDRKIRLKTLIISAILCITCLILNLSLLPWTDATLLFVYMILLCQMFYIIRFSTLQNRLFLNLAHISLIIGYTEAISLHISPHIGLFTLIVTICNIAVNYQISVSKITLSSRIFPTLFSEICLLFGIIYCVNIINIYIGYLIPIFSILMLCILFIKYRLHK